MKISFAKPPFYEEANAFFKLEELNLGTIFTYGDTLYNPFQVNLTQDLLVHEAVHMEQQCHDKTMAKLWWRLFLDDPIFRLEQEVEAYGAQYQYICSVVKDRNQQAKNLYELGGFLAGPMYGNLLSPTEARRLIKQASLNKRKVVK